MTGTSCFHIDAIVENNITRYRHVLDCTREILREYNLSKAEMYGVLFACARADGMLELSVMYYRPDNNTILKGKQKPRIVDTKRTDKEYSIKRYLEAWIRGSEYRHEYQLIAVVNGKAKEELESVRGVSTKPNDPHSKYTVFSQWKSEKDHSQKR